MINGPFHEYQRRESGRVQIIFGTLKLLVFLLTLCVIARFYQKDYFGALDSVAVPITGIFLFKDEDRIFNFIYRQLIKVRILEECCGLNREMPFAMALATFIFVCAFCSCVDLWTAFSQGLAYLDSNLGISVVVCATLEIFTTVMALQLFSATSSKSQRPSASSVMLDHLNQAETKFEGSRRTSRRSRGSESFHQGGTGLPMPSPPLRAGASLLGGDDMNPSSLTVGLLANAADNDFLQTGPPGSARTSGKLSLPLPVPEHQQQKQPAPPEAAPGDAFFLPLSAREDFRDCDWLNRNAETVPAVNSARGYKTQRSLPSWRAVFPGASPAQSDDAPVRIQSDPDWQHDTPSDSQSHSHSQSRGPKYARSSTAAPVPDRNSLLMAAFGDRNERSNYNNETGGDRSARAARSRWNSRHRTASWGATARDTKAHSSASVGAEVGGGGGGGGGSSRNLASAPWRFWSRASSVDLDQQRDKGGRGDSAPRRPSPDTTQGGWGRALLPDAKASASSASFSHRRAGSREQRKSGRFR